MWYTKLEFGTFSYTSIKPEAIIKLQLINCILMGVVFIDSDCDQICCLDFVCQESKIETYSMNAEARISLLLDLPTILCIVKIFHWL